MGYCTVSYYQRRPRDSISGLKICRSRSHLPSRCDSESVSPVANKVLSDSCRDRVYPILIPRFLRLYLSYKTCGCNVCICQCGVGPTREGLVILGTSNIARLKFCFISFLLRICALLYLQARDDPHPRTEQAKSGLGGVLTGG
jgi:hypothetical protein